MGDEGTVSWRALLEETAQRLGAAGIESADIDARRIVERASGHEGADFHRALDQPATVRGVAALDSMMERRLDGEPLQYVVGRWGFRRLDLLVDRRALIPRPETEVVAGFAIDELDRLVTAGVAGRSPVVVDLGTGTGAIGLSVALETPGTEVWLTDVSTDTLAVARANLAGLGRLAVGVRVAEGSWFGALPDELAGRIDLVVSNPPYVRADEVLPSVVAAWEPRDALVAGSSGLEAYDVLIPGAADWLARHGSLVLEAASDQVDELVQRCERAGFVSVSPFTDLAGRSRGVVARRHHHP